MIELAVKINSPEKKYPITISNTGIEFLHDTILESACHRKILVVISEKVDKLYGKILNFKKEEKFVLKDGEKEKNFKNYKKIINFALKLELTRNDTIVAIGGGVIGDIAGFVASTYMRGIRLIQVPTTLLACVDSSVGGKTAINTDFGKNLVGCFYQPNCVLINTNFLKTLDDRQFKTGLGEVVKYAFIEKSCQLGEDLNLINFLSENTDKILDKNPEILEKLIEMCVRLKISVVEKDEMESGLRRILNFGHTYAHALEKFTNYKKFTHGEAVIKGIDFAFKLALKRNLIEDNYKFLADDVIKKFNFKKIPNYPIDELNKYIKLDKKSDNNYISYILPDEYSRVDEFKLTLDDLVV